MIWDGITCEDVDVETDAGDVCHHGIPWDEVCEDCDEEIAAEELEDQ